jgi:tRNA-specific 2-thiouridylase
VPSNTDHEAYVVTRLDMERNELVVAFDRPDSPGLYTSEVDLCGVSFLNKAISGPVDCLAKPRYRDPSQNIHYEPSGPDSARIIFSEPQRALASGQVLALYEGEKLLGGGFYR